MCLAIPGKITSLNEGNLATVDILGATRDISIDLTPKAKEGDFVLVHAGFAIEVVSEEFAQETLDLISEFPDLVEDGLVTEASSGAPSEPSLRSLLVSEE